MADPTNAATSDAPKADPSTAPLSLSFRYDLPVLAELKVEEQTGLDAALRAQEALARAVPKPLSAKGQEVIAATQAALKQAAEAGAGADKIAEILVASLQQMPLGDLPGGDAIASGLSGLPILSDVGDLKTKSFKDISKSAGKVAGDKAKALIVESAWFKWVEEHKPVYYSLIVLAAVGAGTLLYTQGNDILGVLKVPLEIKQEFFDKKLKLGGSTEFAKKLESGNAKLFIGTEFGKLDLRLSGGASWKKPEGGELTLPTWDTGLQLKLRDPGLGLKSLDFQGSYSVGDQRKMSFGLVGDWDRTRASLAVDQVINGETSVKGGITTQLWGAYVTGSVSQSFGGPKPETRAELAVKINF